MIGLQIQQSIRSAWFCVLFTILLGCFPLQSCRQPNPTLLLTEPLSIDKSLLQTHVGKNFEIVLPSLGASPRYHWVLKEPLNEELISLKAEKPALSKYLNKTAPPDYAPNTIFVFTTLKEGQYKLIFAQASLSDPEHYSGVERSFEVQVKIDPTQ